MIPPGYEVRDVVREDFERITELINRTEQEKLTVEDHLQRWENKSRRQWRRVATHGGEIVGYIGCLEAITGKPGIGLVRIEVEEAHQGKGLGRAILVLAEDAGRELGVSLLTSKVREDMGRERRFFDAAGYEAFSHLQGVTLDFEAYAKPPLKEGTELIRNWTQIGDTPENRRKLYEMYAPTEEGSPGIEVWGIPNFENWETAIFPTNWFRPEGLLVASEDDEWVGISIIGQMEDDIWTTDYTGVLPAHRGKGIAGRLKVAGLEYARANGAKAIHTFNDVLNAPMRAINNKLGFQAETGWLMLRKNP